MIRFNCQNCGQKYKADESFAGEEIECNRCATSIPVPNVSESALPPAISNISKVGESKATQELKMPKLSMPAIGEKTNESTMPPKLKMPKLSMPASVGEKINESTMPPKLKIPKLNLSVSAGKNINRPAIPPSIPTTEETDIEQ